MPIIEWVDRSLAVRIPAPSNVVPLALSGS
jgi:hypothetical protein